MSQEPPSAAPRPLKVWLASCVFGVVGVLWLTSALTSLATSNVADPVLALGFACSSLSIAIDPESVFRPAQAGITAGVAARRSRGRVVLGVVGLVCLLTAPALFLLGL